MAAKVKKEETKKESEKISKKKASSSEKSEKMVDKNAANDSAVKKTTKTTDKTLAKVKAEKKEPKKESSSKTKKTESENIKDAKTSKADSNSIVEEKKAKVKKASSKSKSKKTAEAKVTRIDIAANNIDEILNNSELNDEVSNKNKIEPEQEELLVDENYTGPRYSDEDLELFKITIIKAKNEAAEDLRIFKERLEDYNNTDFAEESMIYSMHMAEQGPEALEQEKNYAQVHRLSEYIKKLDDALLRIKDKTYGICRKCKCLIAKERLLAVPVTTLSASFKIHQRCPQDGIDKIEPIFRNQSEKE